MNRRIDDKAFVKAWMTHNDLDEVAAKLGVKKSVIYSKAHSLRKRGVNLPRKQRTQKSEFSIQELNELIESYAPKTKREYVTSKKWGF